MPSVLNKNPLRLNSIPPKTVVGSEDYHPMTSSSKLNIIHSMVYSERALFGCFVLKSITEVFLYSSTGTGQNPLSIKNPV